MAENRVIGRDGALPWRLPDDMRHFKRLTTGHAVLMGRRTFDSIGRPLPDRRNIVLSRDPAFRPAGVEVVGSLDDGLAAAAGDDEVFIAGGGEIFATAIDRADRLYLTVVHADMPGDVTFPPIDPDAWSLRRDDPHPADDRHAHAFSFRVYERRGRSHHSSP